MPVRSLSSSVLKWPDNQLVAQGLSRWAEHVTRERHDVRRIGYFGSYARGDWGVGSDLDVVIIIDKSEQPFEKRVSEWDLTSLPVPADVLVYTQQEWKALQKQKLFFQNLASETVWVYGSPERGGMLSPKTRRMKRTSRALQRKR